MKIHRVKFDREGRLCFALLLESVSPFLHINLLTNPEVLLSLSVQKFLLGLIG